MKIGHINVRSLNNCFDTFKDIVLENDYYFIGVSETWLSEDIPSNFISIPNFNIVRLDRNGRGGGVACYLRSNLKYSIYYSSTDENNLEQLWLLINFNKQKLALGIVYRPPSSSVVLSLSELGEILERVYLESDIIILMGDININLLNETPQSKMFLDLLNNFELQQIVKDPTRVTQNTQTLIDVICVSQNVNFKNSNTTDVLGISDHMLVSCEVSTEKEMVCPDIIYYRNFSNIDLNSFAIDATYHTPWNNLSNFQNIN